jgi:2-succinyl-5-enolpyruvyl-6-hydroxy-3-cyclohexene-1-carboxylate synthase
MSAASRGRLISGPWIEEPAFGPAHHLPGYRSRRVDDRNYRFTAPFVAALADLGVEHACIAPGSRSSPFSMTLAAHPGIEDWSHHDERSAAFFALGIARTTRRPAVVVCTSGTAAAELLPALVEARYGRVPLIALTADRPTDLWESGAPQAVDQRTLYGATPKWSHDLDVPAPGDTAKRYPTALAARLVAEACGVPPGPVHLNLRFREPLVPPPGPVLHDRADAPELHLGGLRLDPAAVAALCPAVEGRRGLLVAGPQDDPGLPAAAAAFAGAAGFPVLADPLSGLRAGDHDRSRVIGTGDLLAGAGFLDRAAPEVVIRTGALPTSRPVWDWLGAHPEVPQIHIDDAGWRDPASVIGKAVRAGPAATLADLAGRLSAAAPAAWAERWTSADRAVALAREHALDGLGFPTEPGVARAVADGLPDGALLHVASSMPIRDVDACFPVLARSIRITSNRGASGIDGFLSSGLGAAATWPGPVTLLAGDLSLLHDLTALGAAARYCLPATIVVVNNDGGGIFHLLPQVDYPEVFERHFGTPHGLDFVRAAGVFEIPAELVDRRDRLVEILREAPQGPRLVEVRTDRAANVAVHAALRQAAEEVVADL